MSGTLIIRDDALWAKHIDDAEIRRRITTLGDGEPLRLVVDGNAIVFRKMSTGRDGRPTLGLKADADDRESRLAWVKLQDRRGETVPVSMAAHQAVDPYLAYLDDFLWEWKTPEDAAAFDEL